MAVRSGRHGATVVAAVVALALLLLLGGTAAASFPVVNVQAERSPASMLPASTMFAVSVDLNPSAQARADLTAMGHAFTDQPAWAGLQQKFAKQTAPSSPENRCYQDTGVSYDDLTRYLGHDTTVAVMRPPRLSNNTARMERFLRREVVLLAPLDAHLTLFQVLFHTPVPALQRVGSYRGFTIDRRDLPSCASVARTVPTTVFIAMVDGYTVIAAGQAALKSVIDVATGHGSALTSNATYRRVMAQLPSPRLATYYVDPTTLHLSSLQKVAGRSVPHMPARPSGPTAGAVTVAGQTLCFTAVMWTKREVRSTGPSAGAIASVLPANTLALVSVQSFARTLRQIRDELARAHLLTPPVRREVNPVLNDLTATMRGEADFVMLKPVDPGGSGGMTDLPAGLMWRTGSARQTFARLGDAAGHLGIPLQLRAGSTPEGTPYRIVPGGSGFGVWHRWAVISGNTPVTLVALEDSVGIHLSQVSAYRHAFPVRGTAIAAMYFDVSGLRSAFETILLPHMGAQARAYRQFVVPLIAPIHTITGSSVVTDHGHLSEGSLRVRIGD
ncbi:MAG TPA: DUF3352 domain-containing protein [Chloroflexota bacterium]|nr:DUF3352 domain-containing protein [Chloroflexota bacterium]